MGNNSCCRGLLEVKCWGIAREVRGRGHFSWVRLNWRDKLFGLLGLIENLIPFHGHNLGLLSPATSFSMYFLYAVIDNSNISRSGFLKDTFPFSLLPDLVIESRIGDQRGRDILHFGLLLTFEGF